MLHSHAYFTPCTAEEIWLECWMESYGQSGQIVAGRGLPWLLKRPAGWFGGGTILHSPTNMQTPRYAPADWQGAATLDDLKRHIGQHGDQLALDYLPEDSAPVVWAKAQPRDRDLLIAQRARVPVTDCSTPFDAFVQRRSKRERQRIRRLVSDSELAEHGFAFAVHRHPDAVQSLLPACLHLEQAGWKGSNRTAILDDAAHSHFYRALADRASQVGAIRLATLHRQGRLIAFEYCLLRSDRLFALKTSYDEAFAASSPGHMLAVLHIRHCCEDPHITDYDVTGNGMTPSAHVMRYADRLDTLYQLTVFAGTARGRMLRKANDLRGFLRTLKRSWPRSAG